MKRKADTQSNGQNGKGILKKRAKTGTAAIVANDTPRILTASEQFWQRKMSTRVFAKVSLPMIS
tara:strand:+ start:1567 stop:1758 length:192 start_codon:yes stop_codon:yes gene_type:complete